MKNQTEVFRITLCLKFWTFYVAIHFYNKKCGPVLNSAKLKNKETIFNLPSKQGRGEEKGIMST